MRLDLDAKQDASGLHVRSAQRDDAVAIVAIHNEGIAGRMATFETRQRTASEIALWFDEPRYPRLVAEREGRVVGWIAASSYRSRECYAGFAEFSVYVAAAERGRRVGDVLMGAFLPACEIAGFWKVLSRIFVENMASRSLCRRHGFREVGTYERHAKLERCVAGCRHRGAAARRGPAIMSTATGSPLALIRSGRVVRDQTSELLRSALCIDTDRFRISTDINAKVLAWQLAPSRTLYPAASVNGAATSMLGPR